MDCEDRARAITCRMLGWPNLARHMGEENGTHLTHDIFTVDPGRNLSQKKVYGREPGRDPASIALAEAGAQHADPPEFRALDGDGRPEYPLSNAHFTAPR